MPTHPFEGNEPPQESEPEAVPCPECGGTKGFAAVGVRFHCLNCNALLTRRDIFPNESNQESK